MDISYMGIGYGYWLLVYGYGYWLYDKVRFPLFQVWGEDKLYVGFNICFLSVSSLWWGFFKYDLIFRLLDIWSKTWFVFVQNIGVEN
jgi:hypothetical protein